MSAVSDAAVAIVAATKSRDAYPPVGLVIGKVTATRYLAAGTVGEIDVTGVTDGVLSIPRKNWLSSFATVVAAGPASVTNREVLVLVSSQRAFVIGVMA